MGLICPGDRLMPLSPFATININLTLLNNISTMSLHTDYSDIGLNEVTGGDPPYTRQPVTFIFNDAYTIQSTNHAEVDFDVPPNVLVTWIGLWGLLGDFLGMVPLMGAALLPFVVDDVVLNPTIVKYPRIGNTGDAVIPYGSQLPLDASLLNLMAGSTYYVTSFPTDTTVELSTTPGGDPIEFATQGVGLFQLITFSPIVATQSMLRVVGLFNQCLIAATLAQT